MSYHVFVYNGSEPKNVTKVFSNVDSVLLLISFVLLFKVNLIVFKQSIRLHFLDDYVKYQKKKGNK